MGLCGDLSAQGLEKEVASATRCCTSGCRRQTKQNYHYVEEVDSPRDYDEKLAVDGQGLLHSRVMSYVASKSQKRAFSELPLFVRPLTISPKAITKGITSGRRFLKRPGVEIWPMPQLGTSTTARMNSSPRLAGPARPP